MLCRGDNDPHRQGVISGYIGRRSHCGCDGCSLVWCQFDLMPIERDIQGISFDGQLERV